MQGSTAINLQSRYCPPCSQPSACFITSTTVVDCGAEWQSGCNILEISRSASSILHWELIENAMLQRRELIGNEYAPSSQEEVATGAVGVMLFVLLMIFSAASTFIWNIRNMTNKAFFAAVFLMALFELPRYAMMSDSGTYISQGAYGCHVLAGVFFFLSYSCVAYQWVGILNMAGVFGAIYSPQGLFVINAIFALLDLISASICFDSNNLEAFFTSDFFIAVTTMETLKNLVFSVVLLYFGLKLVLRFRNYTSSSSSTAVTNSRLPTGIMMSNVNKKGSLLTKDSMQSGSHDDANMGNSDRSVDFFERALVRINVVLIIATICFTIRIVMLICKMVAFHDNVIVTSPGFPLFGFGWFFFSDFVPRLVPTSAFILAMVFSHRHTEADKQYFATQASRVASGKFSDMLDPEPLSSDERSSGSVAGDRLSDEDLNLSTGRGDSAIRESDPIPSRV